MAKKNEAETTKKTSKNSLTTHAHDNVLKTTSHPALSPLDKELLTMAGKKSKRLKHFQHDDHCACSTSATTGETSKVDLIVLIDTSGSMGPKAKAIELATQTAIDESVKRCQVDLKVEYLGIGSAFSNTTIFSTTASDYLNKAGCKSKYADKHPEEGADTISDLSSCPEIWREDACKAIFYVSDEPLDKGADQSAADTAAAQQAINIAAANDVRVFAHLAPGTPWHNNADTIKDYTDLCEQTGGIVYIGQAATASLYEEILKEVICGACKGCKRADMPDYSPCLSVVWGDSPKDCLESEDFELLFIKATNCYDNLLFRSLTIAKITILDVAGKPPAPLPDGRPSIEVFPKGPICFGDLLPCSEREPSCKVRELAIRFQNTIPGKYQLKLEDVNYELHFQYETADTFLLDVVVD